MIWSWKKAQWRRFPLVLNRFTAPVSLTAVDNDRLVTVSESEHNVKLQRMFQELWLIMFMSFTDIYGFASHTNEISCFLVQSVWIWVTTAPHNVTTVQYCKILQFAWTTSSMVTQTIRWNHQNEIKIKIKMKYCKSCEFLWASGYY